MKGMLHGLWAMCQDNAVICVLKFTDLAGLCLCMGLESLDVLQTSIKAIFQMNTISVSQGMVEEVGDG